MVHAAARLLSSPLRNLAAVVGFMLVLIAVATCGYMLSGWSFSDALYMVLITVFSVGYEEIRRTDTPGLRALTAILIAVGCTGMILLTGVLVQVFTVGQIRQLLGWRRLSSEIDRLKDHVVICGFGRIGVMLAADLKTAGTQFVIVERNEARIEQAAALGYLCLQHDAADEAGLTAAGIGRAKVLATVLPDDAANVFITLSARRLNPDLHIIARGEQPSTESKLIYAGADKVVLPTHIGAERIAGLILYPETARFVAGSERMDDFDKTLRDLGLNLKVVSLNDNAGAVGATVAEMEKRGKGAFFVVQLERRDGETITRPAADIRLQPGDGVLVVSRADATTLAAILQAPAERMQVGRNYFRGKT